jgi:H+-transporting ATPase
MSTIHYGFFPLTALMLIALALMDDVPIMTIAYDNSTVSPQPVKWDMGGILLMSTLLGVLAVAQSCGLLYIGDTIHHLDLPHLQSMMFLQSGDRGAPAAVPDADAA